MCYAPIRLYGVICDETPFSKSGQFSSRDVVMDGIIDNSMNVLHKSHQIVL